MYLPIQKSTSVVLDVLTARGYITAVSNWNRIYGSSMCSIVATFELATFFVIIASDDELVVKDEV